MTESSGHKGLGERGVSAARRSSILLGERHTSFFHRVTARAIDLLLGAAIYFLGSAVFPALGAIGAFIFVGLQDSWGEGQSIGKKIIGLRVVDDATGEDCAPQGSFLRNLPFAAAFLLVGMSFFWIFLIAVILPVIALELYLLYTLESGIRLGDVMGNTLVIEDLPVPVAPQG